MLLEANSRIQLPNGMPITRKSQKSHWLDHRPTLRIYITAGILIGVGSLEPRSSSLLRNLGI
ncbi:hypothetical protein PVAG01_03539 [Phlyctema vagabunda]|uniref:Uncharacterized protein n=1 Tax=Phlyctema vagabunda TaxID=108571 RepID=A0ABR4PLR8_9HELO